jgi:fused-like protein
MTWPQILEHKFVKGHILILKEDAISESPFTTALSDSQHLKKEEQTAQLMKHHNHKIHRSRRHEVYDDNLMSSRDSIKAILQSDLEEVPETDVDEEVARVTSTDNSNEANQKNVQEEPRSDLLTAKPPITGGHNINFTIVPENENLVINRLYDNFPNLELDADLYMQQQNMMFNCAPNPNMLGRNMQMQNLNFPFNQEIKKLSQDLDNFSLKIEKSMDAEKLEKSAEKHTKSDATQSNIISTDESINSPVENEEWLQFLCKSMQEILDGELDIYKQENMVSF